jgi:heptosyltransferase-2
VTPAVTDRVPPLVGATADSPARTTARRLLGDAVPGGGGPLIGIHLGAAYGASKLWPAEHVAELCRLLTGRGEVPVLLGPSDAVDVARRLADETGATSLVGRDSPELLPALLTELDTLVCGDTGIGHLAAALGTPVVALFGPTDPRLSAPRGHACALSHAVPCAPCFYRTCPIDHPCLRGVTAGEVLDTIEALRTSARGVAR